MVDHVFTLKTDRVYTFSSRKFSIADMTQFSSRCFWSRHVVLKFSRVRSIHIYKATRFLHMQSEERERERERVTKSVEVEGWIACYSVVVCYGLLA